MGKAGTLLLIVDDDEPTREALRELLEAEGHEVVTASNGADAAHRMTQAPHPDLAIVDLMMPVMDGWELVSRLRAEPQFANLPVIILTAFGGRALSTAPVAAAFLSKPVRAQALIAAVRRALVQESSPLPSATASTRMTTPTTPIQGSGPYPLLQQAAEDTAQELARLGTAEAGELAVDLRGIAAEIRGWRPDSPPSEEHRTRVTNDLVFKTQHAFVLLGRSKPLQ